MENDFIPKKPSVADLLNQDQPSQSGRSEEKAKSPGYAEAIAEYTKKNKDLEIKPLRTYQSDVAEAIKKDNVSMVKMAIAEKKREENRTNQEITVSQGFKLNLAIVLVSVLLIVGGLATAGYVYYRAHQPVQNFQPQNTSHLFYTDTQKQTSLNDTDSISLVNKLEAERNTFMSLGSIEELRFTETQGTTTSIASSADFLNILKARVTPEFLRSLNPDFYYGIYSYKPVGNFIILKIDSYENAYAGMLAWENSMDTDIGRLFDHTNNPTAPNKLFTDKIILNLDARALTDSQGIVHYFYTFIDRSTLIIASDQETLKEVLARMTSTQISR
ncbi:MAG: hypothetical protein PHF79_01505 [Candidatus Pacebacteria bacterium]|nr:hypothetical protein [Candidatus Paceibacterota bacterium]